MSQPSYPAQSDYQAALQNLDVAFAHLPRLRVCQVEKNRMQLPRGRSGAFASVYRLTQPDGTFLALKLFNFANAERQSRYELVSRHVNSLGARKPSGLVSFEYISQGIQVKSQLFPIQIMDWVAGESLGYWLRLRMENRDYASVKQLATHWVELVQKLQAAEIAHGDLQHDNIIVRGGTPVLVDYDGMWVPALTGKRMDEEGKPAYQHPQRNRLPLHRGLDAFSAWVITIALRAVIADPPLYQRFVLKTNNENLLFTKEDLATPTRSALWLELLRSPDAEVQRWAKDLRDCLDRPPQEVPPFEFDSFLTLRRIWASRPRDWESLVREADRLQRLNHALPADSQELVSGVQEARTRLAHRDRLRQALASGDPRQLVSCYQPTLLNDWPAEQRLARETEAALQAIARLDELRAAATRPQQPQLFLQLWQQHKANVGHFKECAGYEALATSWKSQDLRIQQFLKVVQSPSSTDRSIAEAWQSLQAGQTSLGAVPQAAQERAQLAIRRLQMLGQLETCINRQQPLDRQDQELIQLWNSSQILLKDSPEAAGYRDRVAIAMQRIEKWRRFEALLKQDTLADLTLYANDPDLQAYAGFQNQAALIAKRMKLAQRFQSLQQALTGRPPLRPLTAELLQFVREQYHRLSPADRQAFLQKVTEQLRQATQLQPGEPTFELFRPQRSLKVYWDFVSHDLLSGFLVAISANQPYQRVAEVPPAQLSTCTIAQHSRGGGGLMLLLPPLSPVYVSIWPIAELGWTRVEGVPLLVGPLDLESPPARRR